MIQSKVVLNPGFVIIPKKPTIIYSVVGSGIVITAFDRLKKFGGASYFTKPQTNSKVALPFFAEHSLIMLLKLMQKEGAKKENLEFQIFGGAENKKIRGFVQDLAQNNIKSIKKLVFDYALNLIGEEVGGNKGRKIMFNTKTGEIIIAKVLTIRESDWYPK